MPIPPPLRQPHPAPHRPLLLSRDPALLEAVLHLAAGDGLELEVAPDPGAARRRWPAAPLVLVGADQAGDLAAFVRGGLLARRAGVVLVTADLDDAGVWERAVAVGAEHVACLPDAEAWLAASLAAAGHAATPAGAANRVAAGEVIGVVGGRGGAGATVLAVALALAGVRAGMRTVLLDADPLGGGIDLALGAERGGGPWEARPRGAGGDAPAGPPAGPPRGLPRVGELTVLAPDRPGPAVPEAMSAVLAAARTGSDLVVVDLPRHLDPAARVVLDQAHRVLLVVPGEVRAAAAAARVLATLRPAGAEVALVVRRGAGRLPDRAVAGALGLPLAGSLPPEPGLATRLERGEAPGRAPGPLARLCDRLVAQTAPAAAPGPAGRG